MSNQYRENISVEEARSIVIDCADRLKPEPVPLVNALGAVCARKVRPDMDVPDFDNSAMDGFAVRASDVKKAGTTLKIIGEVKAGGWFKRKVGRGQAVRIMTGALMPAGADSVVRKEDTTEKFGGVTITISVNKRDNVRPKGEDIKKGEVVIEPGEVLTTGKIGVAASCGYEEILVYPKPKVSIVSTGDELVKPSIKPRPGQVRTSNSYSLIAQVQQANAIPFDIGIAKDTLKSTRSKLQRAMKLGDVIITSGGVSVGEYDFVKEVMDELGMKIKFWRVRQRPGHPLVFGQLEAGHNQLEAGHNVFKASCPMRQSVSSKGDIDVPQALVFGLPGNPVASMVCFEQYVRPALLKMMGHQNLLLTRVTAELTTDVKVKAGRTYFLRAVVRQDSKGVLKVGLTGPQGSGILKSMALANALIVVPEKVKTLSKGQMVEVDLLPGQSIN